VTSKAFAEVADVIPLPILDFAQIVEGGDAAQSLRNSIRRARPAVAWGYKRFWLTEHQNLSGVRPPAANRCGRSRQRGTHPRRSGGARDASSDLDLVPAPVVREAHVERLMHVSDPVAQEIQRGQLVGIAVLDDREVPVDGVALSKCNTATSEGSRGFHRDRKCNTICLCCS
jgi:hypothetical protein